MPRHLISDAHEWINEIPTVPIQLEILTSKLEVLLMFENHSHKIKE